jgi:hypothetical protein
MMWVVVGGIGVFGLLVGCADDGQDGITSNRDETAQERSGMSEDSSDATFSGESSDSSSGSENDHDQDAVPDTLDNCPNTPNPNQADCDRDKVGDVCDNPNDDCDFDGIIDSLDNCPAFTNPDQTETQSGGCDYDAVPDSTDNCQNWYNPDQAPLCEASLRPGKYLIHGSIGYTAETTPNYCPTLNSDVDLYLLQTGDLGMVRIELTWDTVGPDYDMFMGAALDTEMTITMGCIEGDPITMYSSRPPWFSWNEMQFCGQLSAEKPEWNQSEIINMGGPDSYNYFVRNCAGDFFDISPNSLYALVVVGWQGGASDYTLAIDLRNSSDGGSDPTTAQDKNEQAAAYFVPGAPIELNEPPEHPDAASLGGFGYLNRLVVGPPQGE